MYMYDIRNSTYYLICREWDKEVQTSRTLAPMLTKKGLTVRVMSKYDCAELSVFWLEEVIVRYILSLHPPKI
jgi:hypothetical protein